MQKKFLGLTVLAVAVAGMSYGQIKKQFSVDDAPSCNKIKLKLQANSGTCFIKPSHNPEILSVFSNQTENNYSHQFVKEINGKVCEVTLSLEENESGSLSQTVSSRMFGSERPEQEKFWKMYLTEAKPYSLELNYGVGSANVDLSGLAIKTLKINTGSADVNIGYHSGLENLVEMDTFSVRVDLGSVNAKNLSLARTKYVVANVGFGNVMLDLSTAPQVANHIKGSVGAGNLVILLPSDDSVPVLVHVKDSWLCSVELTDDLKETAPNTYANAAYAKNPKKALTFDLDVSLGNIVFKEKP
ncbi:MAG: hypothetical protein JNK18_17865 [Cyclobacteriaceae bacterium]|nr:hypothetical protein [Cyclobacteriaceae bacterium]